LLPKQLEENNGSETGNKRGSPEKEARGGHILGYILPLFFVENNATKIGIEANVVVEHAS
jgi:hypothetical protein